MESPPSTSTWSDPFILSDDSGLLLTGSSVSSGSMSGESHTFSRFATDMQDSDCEDKSFSQADSLDGMSDIMCGENFNTLKKGPHWLDIPDCKSNTPIEPPLEFQDKPNIILYESLANSLIPTILNEAIRIYCKTVAQCMDLLPMHNNSNRQMLTSSYWTSDFLPFASPPSSRRSLVSSRFSSSHNSLSVPSAHKVDDSSFITQAVSHDALVSSQISDIYNVPFDSDMYAVPVDVVRQQSKPRRVQQYKKRRRNTSSCCRELEDQEKHVQHNNVRKYCVDYIKCKRLIENRESATKRHSVAGSSAHIEGEPVHMTLQEVRHYLQTLYSSSSDSSVHKNYEPKNNKTLVTNNNKYVADNNNLILTSNNNKSTQRFKKNTFLINLKNKRIKDTCESIGEEQILVTKPNKSKKSFARMTSFKQTLCNIFRFKRFLSPERKDRKIETNYNTKENNTTDKENNRPPTRRALPPLPLKKVSEEIGLDFTTSIQKVKDYGWYWGPLSSEAAEKILSNEPDGSFIVRDSSDDHYIFSLTFKLNNSVRHVRIEHDQGNFSFGSCTKFKSQTIVEFIENAVEHSRSGRYLFFLHRRPVIGPVRVQLLHPVSRFKQIQSLQHMCRFVILKLVRRDLLSDLPLPRRMLDYLNTPHYYSENLCDIDEQEDNSSSFFDTSTDPQNIYTNNNVISNEPVAGSRIYENSSSTFHSYNRQS